MHKRKHIKTPCIILGTNELLEGNHLHLVSHISETDTGPYAGLFCQGGNELRVPIYLNMRQLLSCPIYLKYNKNCKFNFLWGGGNCHCCPPPPPPRPSVYGAGQICAKFDKNFLHFLLKVFITCRMSSF